MMKNEVYLWIALFVIIAVVALYLRFYYQPQLSLTLALAPGTPAAASLYPYQKLELNMTIDNTGSATASNLSVGAYVNGNITTLYRIYLPAGKSEQITFNYSTLNAPGLYNVYIAIDPDKLYNIADRQKTAVSYNLTVIPSENATPAENLPSNGISSESILNSGSGGYEIGEYLNLNYSVTSLSFNGTGAVGDFLGRFFYLTASSYIKNYSIASVAYNNGSSAYSVWLKGYLTQPTVGLAAEGMGYNVINYSNKGLGPVSYVDLQGNTTLCGWYSGGWLKLLFYNGSSCLGLLNNSNGPTINYASDYDKLLTFNGVVLANYSEESHGSLRTSALAFGDGAFYYDTIWRNNTATQTCYGLVEPINGISYCSQVLIPLLGQLGNFSAVETTAQIGKTNVSLIAWPVNSSKLINQIPLSASVLGSFGVTGTSVNFTSTVNGCYFGASFQCTNASVTNSIISFTLKNTVGSTVKLNSIGCYEAGPPVNKTLGYSLAANAVTTISVPCYEDGSLVQGVQIGAGMELPLNYTVGGQTGTLTGDASVNIPS